MDLILWKEKEKGREEIKAESKNELERAKIKVRGLSPIRSNTVSKSSNYDKST